MYIFHTFIDQNKINSKVIPIKNATRNDFSKQTSLPVI